ncbi:hypothetical protein ACFV6F_32090 [Kitasatospora phosalacinea]|uniref:hypothetical protein n=1 Tax=Kitasatospora phosalacinea TaxID=2065 RepID=UPI00364C7309
MRHSISRALSRRLGGAVVAVTTVAVTAAAPVAAAPVARVGRTVDLAVRTELVQQTPGTTDTQQVTVTNQGERTTGGSLLTYVTPPYTNIDRDAPLPDGCTMRYQNLDPALPEVVTCVVPAGLGQGEDRTFSMPLAVTSRARLSGLIRGGVSVAPCPGSADTEANLNDNWIAAYLSLTRPTPPVPEGNRTGLYLAPAFPPVSKDGTAESTLTYGNVGPSATTGEVRIVAVTPFAFNVDRQQPLPDGCALALEDAFLGTPEIVVCDLPPLDVDEQRELRLPLRAATGAPPVGLVFNPALIAPVSGQDVEADQGDNVSTLGVQVPSRHA